jgi:protein-S-isoprenylcysteine O-methyltransferase Ste14
MDGSLLAVSGWIVFGVLAFGLRSLLLVVSTEAQVRLVEEPYLLGVHGDAYRAYAARVGRFSPGLGHRLRDPGRDGR